VWLFVARCGALIAHFFVLLYQEAKDSAGYENPQAFARMESAEQGLREAFGRKEATTTSNG